MKNYTTYIMLITAALLAACTTELGRKAEKQPVKVTVAVISEAGGSESVQNYSGVLTENRSAMLSFQTGGKLTKLYVKEGERVSKGRKIAMVDQTQSLNALRSAEAALAQAMDGYDRLKVVHDSGALSDVKWVEMETKLQQANSMAQIARKNLEDCTLYAPFSGVVSSVNMGEGSHLLPSQGIIRLISTDTMLVKLDIPENDISYIEVGQSVDVQVLPLKGKIMKGVVARKWADADNLSHTYPVMVELPNKDGSLLTGMVCKASIHTKGGGGNMVIPYQAVQLMPDGRYVWCVESGKSTRRSVTIGDFASNGVVVTSGLAAGDSVIIDGRQKVYEGGQVSVCTKLSNN